MSDAFHHSSDDEETPPLDSQNVPIGTKLDAEIAWPSEENDVVLPLTDGVEAPSVVAASFPPAATPDETLARPVPRLGPMLQASPSPSDFMPLVSHPTWKAAERPSPAKGSSTASQIDVLFEECRAAALLANKVHAAQAESVEAALEKASALHEVLEMHPAEANNLYERNGIKSRKGEEGNKFTRVIKLVFGIEERATISRYAKVLRYVSDNRRAGEEFRKVIKRGGGLVRCAQADADQHKGNSRERHAQRHADTLDNLRQQGVQFKNPTISKKVESRFTLLLLERNDDGTDMIIAMRAEADDPTISRFKPIRK